MPSGGALKSLTHEDTLDEDRRASYAAEVPLDATEKGRWERSWPTIACGAGLFSDGYLNGVCQELFLFHFSWIDQHE
jgi:hypothetical protein